MKRILDKQCPYFLGRRRRGKWGRSNWLSRETKIVATDTLILEDILANLLAIYTGLLRALASFTTDVHSPLLLAYFLHFFSSSSPKAILKLSQPIPSLVSSIFKLFFIISFYLFGLWGYWHCGHSWPIVPPSGDSEDDCGEADGM
jgi:hypothetical protein